MLQRFRRSASLGLNDGLNLIFAWKHIISPQPTKNPLSLESDKGFGLYIVSTGLRLREDSSSCIDS